MFDYLKPAVRPESTFEPDRRTFEIDGSSMSTVVFGSGPTVVLGPSFLWDWAMWAPQIEALAGRYRVIVPELWGHGGSGSLPAGTMTMRDLARQHLELLDRLEVEHCAIVGLSVGGMWGAELALMAPERVTGLVLMDTSLAEEPSEARQTYFALLDAIGVLGALPDQMLEAVVPLFFSPTVKARHPELPGAFEQSLRDWARDRLEASVVPLGRIIFGRRDLLPRLGELSMPCLVMTGEDDLAQPADRGRVIAREIGCRFTLVPKAGHISSLEAPGFVNSALLEFLDAALNDAPKGDARTSCRDVVRIGLRSLPKAMQIPKSRPTRHQEPKNGDR